MRPKDVGHDGGTSGTGLALTETQMGNIAHGIDERLQAAEANVGDLNNRINDTFASVRDLILFGDDALQKRLRDLERRMRRLEDGQEGGR